MSEPKYTPGPWEIREVAHEKTPYSPRRVYRVEIIAPQYYLGRRTHSRDIAQMVDYCEWMDHPQNARLIAAAPDLLEACKAMMAWNETFDGEDCEGLSAQIEQLRAAIAKAEGR